MTVIDKNFIRKDILEKRKNLDKNFVDTSSEIIINELKKIIISNNLQHIMIYMDMANEVKITNLLSHFTNDKITFYIPKTFPKGIMKVNKYNKNELVPHKFGYYESSSEDYIDEKILDLIIIPGVVFDKNKNRIGFGGGYYDRFLEKLKNESDIYKNSFPLTIAICYDFQLLNSIPTEEHDIKPEIIITEKQIIK